MKAVVARLRSRAWELATLVALVVVGVSLAVVLLRWTAGPRPSMRVLEPHSLLVVGVLFAILAIGELNLVSLPRARESAPLSFATGCALAMTTTADGQVVPLDAATVVVVVALAMLVGLAVRRRRHAAVEQGSVAARFLGICVAVWLFHSVPIRGGGSLSDLRLSGDLPVWLVALAMVAISAVALVAQGLVIGILQSLQLGLRLRSSLLDESRQLLGLNTALVVSGPLIALAEAPLGIAAVPLFLMPLVLTQFAVRRYAGIRATYLQTVRTLSRLTEMGGYTAADHPTRVASLSVRIAQHLGVPEREVTSLEYAALLHDIGQLALSHPIPGGATVLAAPADQDRIALDGAAIVRTTGVLDEVAEVLEVQAKPYRHVRELGENIPIAARIIKVANAYDDLAGDQPTATSAAQAMERIHLGLGYEYDPGVVDGLERVLETGHAGGGSAPDPSTG